MNSSNGPSELIVSTVGEKNFWYGGGNLGLSQDPNKKVFMSIGTPQGTFRCDVETILRFVDRFEPEEEHRVLCLAALHYGMDAWALIEGRGTLEDAMHESDVMMGHPS